MYKVWASCVLLVVIGVVWALMALMLNGFLANDPLLQLLAWLAAAGIAILAAVAGVRAIWHGATLTDVLNSPWD